MSYVNLFLIENVVPQSHGPEIGVNSSITSLTLNDRPSGLKKHG